MRKRILALTTVLFFSLMGLAAQESSADDPAQPENPFDSGGSQLEQFYPVEGLNQWEREFDISDLEAGTYNVLVRARDAAGNVVEAEPVDIRIDPASDLPITSITYPSRDLRINGDLTVLGSARDDDAIDYIEVRLGEGEFVRAEGDDFWSIRFPTEGLSDGRYTLEARSFDINGLEGGIVRQSFFLDRASPQITLESHGNGDLVSGRFSISGSSSDANGIAELQFSLDGGQTWEDARLPGSARGGTANFSIAVDSRELADGP
jgi:hypothetical protein